MTLTFIHDEYQPYELSYYEECEKREELQRQIFHLEEERDIAIMQLKNWQNLYKKSALPEQLGWCDLCEYTEYKNENVCKQCHMGSKFEYCESMFGEMDGVQKKADIEFKEDLVCQISKLQKKLEEVK